MGEQPARRMITRLRGLGGAFLLLVPALVTGAPPPEPELVELRLFAGEPQELRLGAIQRLLNLDPAVVTVAQRGAETLVITGLAYGTATVRVWGIGEAWVVRLQVVGERPRAAAAASGLAAPAGPGIGWVHELAYHGYWNGGTSRRSAGVASVDLDALFTAEGGDRARLRTWVEEREQGVTVPHYALAIERQREGTLRETRLDLGYVDLKWGQFGFTCKRLNGARLGLAAALGDAARPTLGLELAFGRDALDFVRLGTPTALPEPQSADRVGGARLWWQPAAGVELGGSWQFRRAGAGELAGLVELGGKARWRALDLRGALAADGEHLGSQLGLRSTLLGASLRFDLRRVDSGLNTLHGGTGLLGSQSWNAEVSRAIGESLRVDLASSRSRAETTTPHPLEASRASRPESFEADSEAVTRAPDRIESSAHAIVLAIGPRDTWSLRLEGRRGESRLIESQWAQRSGAVELRLSGTTERGAMRAGVNLRLETRRDRASGLAAGSYGWQSARARTELAIGSWLTFSGSYEQRFADHRSVLRPLPAVWDALVAVNLAGARLPFDVRATFTERSWDSLDLSDGALLSGRLRSATIELSTRPWHGLTFRAAGSWTGDLKLGNDSASIQLGLRSSLGTAPRPPVGGSASDRGPAVVRGLVFLDRDRDGVRDPDEPGLAGISVRRDDGKVTLTARDGTFRFAGTSGAEALVSVVEESAPGRLVATTAKVQGVRARSSARGGISFGLAPAPITIEAIAFNDLDEDGKRGPDEPLVGGVELVTGSGGAALRTDGRGTVSAASAPASEIAGTWSFGSIPGGYLSESSPECRPGPLPEGGRAVCALPLVAVRAIRGVVVLDSNRNGRLDAGESAPAGIVIRAGRRLAVTGADGSFTLKALPAGRLSLAVEGDTLPRGWSLPEPLVVILDPGPQTLRDLVVALLP